MSALILVGSWLSTTFPLSSSASGFVSIEALSASSSITTTSSSMWYFVRVGSLEEVFDLLRFFFLVLYYTTSFLYRLGPLKVYHP